MKLLLAAILVSSCSCSTMRSVRFAEGSEGGAYVCTLMQKGRISFDPPQEWDNREMFCADLNRVLDLGLSEKKTPEPGARGVADTL